MARWALALFITAFAAGCQSELDPLGMTPDVLAATAPYPEHLQIAPTGRITAIVDAGQVHLLNSLDHPIDDTQLWLDRAYMVHIDRIPAHGQLTLHAGDFLDLQRQPPPPDHIAALVQLQASTGKLYQLPILPQ